MKSSFFISPIVPRRGGSVTENNFRNEFFLAMSRICSLPPRTKGYGRHRRHARVHRPPRPHPHAARQPLARAPLDPRLDALRHPRRRWLALVHPGRDHSAGGRPKTFSGCRRSRAGGLARRPPVSAPQESHGPPPPLRLRTSL